MINVILCALCVLRRETIAHAEERRVRRGKKKILNYYLLGQKQIKKSPTKGVAAFVAFFIACLTNWFQPS